MCGPKQTFIWVAPAGNGPSLNKRLPFVLDVCEETFHLIDQLLTEVWEGLDGRRDWPPKQAQECIAVSCLNLLKLQLHAILVHRSASQVRPPYRTVTLVKLLDPFPSTIGPTLGNFVFPHRTIQASNLFDGYPEQVRKSANWG